MKLAVKCALTILMIAVAIVIMWIGLYWAMGEALH